MSEQSIEIITKSDSNVAPTFVDHHSLPDINYNGHCLMKNNIYIPKKVINLYISYTLGPKLKHFNPDFALRNCLFGSVKLTNDLDKYKYTGYGIDLILVENIRNIIIFGVDMNSSVHIHNKRKDTLILGKGPT